MARGLTRLGALPRNDIGTSHPAAARGLFHERTKHMLAFVLARAKEPSTYAGLAAFAAAAGLHFSAAQLDAVTSLGIAVAGAVAVLAPEKK